MASNIGIVLGLLFSAWLLIKQQQKKANLFIGLYLFLYSLRMAKSVFYQHIEVHPVIHNFFLSSLTLMGPLLLFYTQYLKNKTLHKKQLLHLSLFGVLFISTFFIPYLFNSAFSVLLFLQPIAYAVYLNFKINKEKNLTTRTKNWLLVLYGATFIIFSNSIFIFFGITSFYPSSSILFSCCLLFLIIFGSQNISIFKETKVKYANSNLKATEATQHYQKLIKILHEEKLYLDPELTLKKLSELLGISSKLLSQIINQVDKVNYSQFIANYRVKEAKDMLTSNKYKEYKIAAIAFECGFNSISSFNNTFKKIANCTAQQYRTQHLKNKLQ